MGAMQQLIRETQPSIAYEVSIPGNITTHATLRALSIEDPEPGDVRECVLERDGYSIRLASSPGQHSKASMLIKRMYSWRGYHAEAVTALPHNPNQVTLEASSGQHLFGTLTLGLDSEEGLLADALYQDEINAFRARGRKLCELTRFAVVPQFGSKEVLASLFHIAYIYARIVHKASDAFIEVNSRHAGFYERRLGFRQIGGMRICPRVKAPALLLHLELAHMDSQISKHGGSRATKERSLYPYFLSSCEAQSLVDRIRNHPFHPGKGPERVAGRPPVSWQFGNQIR